MVTDHAQKTSVDGLYAAGDVCAKPLRQVVTAVGDGALAAIELERLAAEMQRKTGLRPQLPTSRVAVSSPDSATQSSAPFSADMLAQLHTIFERMSSPLILRLYLDHSPLSDELQQYMEALAASTDCLSVQYGSPEDAEYLPCVRVYREDCNWTRLAFHGIPGGHEFTSFILGLYNAAGPGQPLEEKIRAAVHAIDHPIDLQILVSLSCTMCPDLVTAAQHIAAENPYITAQVYDLNHFPDLQQRYQVMSVPCLVINGSEVFFCNKNIEQLISLISAFIKNSVNR